jgi:hypothetical protein
MSLDILTALFALTQLGDWYTTRTILILGGREVNPLMNSLFKYFNIDLILVIKAIATTFAMYSIIIPNSTLWAIICTIYYVAVVWHNYKQVA